MCYELLCFYMITFIFKGMVPRNIEHFLKKRIHEKLGFSEMELLKKIFFFSFQRPVFLVFGKT